MYAGDDINKKLIVLAKEASAPVYIDVKENPKRGIIIKDSTLLIVGCNDGYLHLFSLNNPLAPSIITTIKLNFNNSWAFLKLSEDKLLCG